MPRGSLKSECFCEIVKLFGGMSNEEALELVHFAQGIARRSHSHTTKGPPEKPTTPIKDVAGSVTRGLLLDFPGMPKRDGAERIADDVPEGLAGVAVEATGDSH